MQMKRKRQEEKTEKRKKEGKKARRVKKTEFEPGTRREVGPTRGGEEGCVRDCCWGETRPAAKNQTPGKACGPRSLDIEEREQGDPEEIGKRKRDS